MRGDLPPAAREGLEADERPPVERRAVDLEGDLGLAVCLLRRERGRRGDVGPVLLPGLPRGGVHVPSHPMRTAQVHLLATSPWVILTRGGVASTHVSGSM